MLRKVFQSFSFSTTKITVREAINSAMAQEITRDPKVILMGEEVGQYDGAYKISKGLYKQFGGTRIVDTPITEAGFTGIGVGAAMHGMRPIIEFMTFNFALQSIDHIINSAAKGHYMSGGDLTCPIVFRGPNGASAAVAAQHSQCFASWYSSVPGLITLCPYDAKDARGLLKSAIRNDNPVVFLENEMMYGDSFELTEEEMGMDYLIEIGKGKVERPGKDVTIVAFAKMVKFSLMAAAELEKNGISCEVINLRSIRPLDREIIVNSVKKTGRIVTVEEGWAQCGVGAEIAALIMECKFQYIASAFDYLDAPLERVTGFDVPTPYAINIEKLAFPSVNNIVNAVNRVCYTRK